MAGTRRTRKKRSRRSTRRGEPAAPRFTGTSSTARARGWHASRATTSQIVVGLFLTLVGAWYAFVLADESGVSPERTLGYLALATVAAVLLAVVNEWVEYGRAPTKLQPAAVAALTTAGLLLVRFTSASGQVILMAAVYAAGLAFLIVVARRDGMAQKNERDGGT